MTSYFGPMSQDAFGVDGFDWDRMRRWIENNDWHFKKSFTVQGDIVSSNWDGTVPLDLSAVDAGATAGFALDSSEGAAQFMGDMFLGGDLTLVGGGIFRSAASGQRVQIGAVNYDQIEFYSGASTETAAASISSVDTGSGGGNIAFFTITGAAATGIDPASISFLNTTGNLRIQTFETGADIWINAVGDIDLEAPLIDISSSSGISMQGGGGLKIADNTGNPMLMVALDVANAYEAAILNNWGNSSNPGITVGTTQSNVGTTLFRVVYGASLSSGLPSAIGTVVAYASTPGDGYDESAWNMYNQTDLGDTAGNRTYISQAMGIASNLVSIDTVLLRDANGSDWTTAAIGFQRRTDATNQSSLWFRGGGISVNTSNSPPGTLYVYGDVDLANNSTTTDSGLPSWRHANTGSPYRLLPLTSSARFKKNIRMLNLTPQIEVFDAVELKEWKERGQRGGGWIAGILAEDAATYHPTYVSMDEEGLPFSYDLTTALMVPMIAKIKQLEARLAILEASCK